MIITRHAPAFFKFQLGDLTVALNPPSKSSSLKASRFGADIVLENIQHADFSGGEDMVLGGKTPFVINGPGEYEIKDVFIRGLPGESMYGAKNGESKINIIYTITIDNIKMCILGLQSNKTLSPEAKAGINEVDILFMAFGEGIISPSDAYKLAVSLEPKVIIPISFNNADLQLFLKEGGSSAKEEDKVTLKRKDLEGKEGDMMVVAIS